MPHFQGTTVTNRAWRLTALRAQVFYALNPLERAVFIPQDQPSRELARPTATRTAAASTPPPMQPPAGTQPSPTATPPPTATLTPTSIPEALALAGVPHEYQQMNNCGPAPLAMALRYWGWQGDQTDTRAFLPPNFASVDDKKEQQGDPEGARRDLARAADLNPNFSLATEALRARGVQAP